MNNEYTYYLQVITNLLYFSMHIIYDILYALKSSKNIFYFEILNLKCVVINKN